MAAATAWRSPRPGRPVTPRPANSRPPKPPQAALLYECADLMGLRHTNKKHTLRKKCQPTAKDAAVHPVLHICETQRRYNGQCELMLQSPSVNKHRELLTGLRAVTVPTDAAYLISAAWVCDYKPNDGAKRRGVPTALVLQGRPDGERPGWMLVLVTGTAYRRYEPDTNAATAAAALRTVLPMLPQWLESLAPVNV